MKTAHVFLLTLIMVISAMTFSCGSNESVLSSEEVTTVTDSDQNDFTRFENEESEPGGK